MSDAIRALSVALEKLVKEESAKGNESESQSLQALMNISTALSELVGVAERGAAESRARETATGAALTDLQEVMTGVNTALGELVGVAERSSGKTGEALAALKLPAPQVNFEPRIEVPVQPLAIEVKAGESHVHVPTQAVTVELKAPDVNVQVPEPKVQVLPVATWKSIRAKFEYSGERLVGAVITRE